MKKSCTLDSKLKIWNTIITLNNRNIITPWFLKKRIRCTGILQLTTKINPWLSYKWNLYEKKIQYIIYSKYNFNEYIFE